MKVGDFATPGWEDAFDREKQLEEAERKRLLYVACTRARDHLIVPVVPRPTSASGMLEWLAPEPAGVGRGARGRASSMAACSMTVALIEETDAPSGGEEASRADDEDAGAANRAALDAAERERTTLASRIARELLRERRHASSRW